MHKHWHPATYKMTETSKLLLTPFFFSSCKDTGTLTLEVLDTVNNFFIKKLQKHTITIQNQQANLNIKSSVFH